MNRVLRKNRVLIVCAHFAPLVCGLAGFATPAGAQTAATPQAIRSASVADSAVPGAAVSADEEIKERVRVALHAAPYLYDDHVTVSLEQGAVVLRGFVLSDSDLQEAIRIAGRAAGTKRVINNLSIKEGGRR